MTKNKMIIGAAALTAIIAVAGIAASSYASSRGDFGTRFKGNFSVEEMQIKKEIWQNHKTAMDEIFANNDYETWKALMEEKVEQMGRRAEEIAKKINQETFSKMSEAHKLMQDGNYEEAMKLMQDLDFGGHMGKMGYKAGGFHRNLAN